MELKEINSKSKDIGELKKIFIEAFPPDERPPYFILLSKAKKTNVDFCGVYDNEKLIGLTYVVSEGMIAYLFFLAIKKEERGYGYGSKVIDILKKKYKDKKLFLALETLDEKAENYKQRLSRHEFYKRCGLSDMQGQIKEGSVIYDIMGIGGKVEPEEYKKLMDNYMGPLMRIFIDTRIIERKNNKS